MEARRTARRRRARVIAKISVFIFDFVEIQPSGSWSGTVALKILIEDDTPLEMISGTSSLAMKESSFATGRAKSGAKETRRRREKRRLFEKSGHLLGRMKSDPALFEECLSRFDSVNFGEFPSFVFHADEAVVFMIHHDLESLEEIGFCLVAFVVEVV